MNFYAKFLTKIGVGSDLELNVSVKWNSQGGLSKQKIEELRNAIRDLGLDDNLCNSQRGHADAMGDPVYLESSSHLAHM